MSGQLSMQIGICNRKCSH